MTIEEMKKRKMELGLSNKELASRSGVPLGTVQKIFSGETKAPRFGAVEKLERVLHPQAAPYQPGFVPPGRPEQAADFGSYSFGSKLPEGTVKEPSFVYGTPAGNEKRQGEYTLADYYALPDEKRVELIDGIIYDMASPSEIHQELLGEIFHQLKNHVKKRRGKCRIILAPFDVQLDKDNRTMVQPDISVICDREKCRPFGCFGAPDMVIEILSPSTSKKDISIKLQKYIKAGVKEYWMVDPKEEQVTAIVNNGEELALRGYSFAEKVPVAIWDNQFAVDFKEIREELSFLYDME